MDKQPGISHEARGTRHEARGTRHEAQGIRHEVGGTREWLGPQYRFKKIEQGAKIDKTTLLPALFEIVSDLDL